MAQVRDHFPNMCEAMGLSPSTRKKKKTKEKANSYVIIFPPE
jgi:hypothetical protein